MAIDTSSATWLAVKEAAEKGLQGAQKRLERPGSDIAETERERGYIKAMREILALSEPKSPKLQMASGDPVEF